MKEYTTDKLRNVALVGHQSSGKTSLVEALLFNTGAINRLGKIDEKNTVSDWDDEEKERGLSLSTSLVPIEFNDHKINVLDAPGFVDFQGEVKNAIRVADATIVVVDAVSGVEVGTELAWRHAEEYNQPIIVAINKMDRENADFDKTLNHLKETFPEFKFIPVMLPIGAEADFKGVVNLMTMKAYYDAGSERSDLPDELADIAEVARVELVEAAAEADDALIEKYFEEETLSNDEIREGMRKAARNPDLKTVPVFVTSGTSNIGTVPLLEALIAYTSAPSARRVGLIKKGSDDVTYLPPPQSDDGQLAGYVFKTMTDKFVGTINYIRLFSGSLSADSRVFNVTRDSEERFANLMVMRGKEQMNVSKVHAGDIFVVAKLSDTKTGDTFGDAGSDMEVMRPTFPAPLYAIAVSPKTQADGAKMGGILTSLCDADPTLRWRQDSDINQTILEGMGNIHVEVVISRADKLGVGMDTEMPKVSYKETVTKTAEATYRHKKQTGGAGQFGEVSLRVEPAEEAYVYETNIFGGAVSSQFLQSADKGIRQVLPEGVIAGYPVEMVKVVVFDGKEHPVDSKDIAFQIAGREAFREAFRGAGPVLMEPIMDVQITVPESMMGDIMSDLNTRRGRVQGMDSIGNKSIVRAEVPMAEMMRYGNDLRSMTGGRGIYTMDFNRYDRVPSHVQQDIIAQNQSEEE